LEVAADNHRSVPWSDKIRALRRHIEKVTRRYASRFGRVIGQKIPENAAEAHEAVHHFLTEMTRVAARLFPAWSKTLDGALAECQLNYDERRALLEIHPVDDYFFAAVVALEAAKLRSLYPPAEAAELLGEIGEQVDAAANRQDRVVSDLVFALLGRIDLGAGADRQKTPHDIVVKGLLQHMGFAKNDSTRELLRDLALRHQLGEALALGVPQWWKAFHGRFMIYWAEPEEDENEGDEPPVAADTPPASTVSPRRRLRRRAVTFN
jgi:hypothetical protein